MQDNFQNKCVVCGQAAPDGYSMCPECFQSLQDGKLSKCNNCGKWYRTSEMCECVKIFDSTDNSKDNTFDEEKESKQEIPFASYKSSEPEGCSRKGCLAFFVVLAIIALIVWLLVEEPWEEESSADL